MNQIDRRDLLELARLHLVCLPDSLVSELGAAYARSFYRYVSSSPDEVLWVERDTHAEVAAGCVLSFRPRSLKGRLLLRTPLLPCLLLRPSLLFKVARSLFQTGGGRTKKELPELILIYASERTRGQGLGRGLVAKVEEKLEAVGAEEYEVRTLGDSSNRALSFYAKLGFVPAHEVFELGRKFQVLTRRLK